MGLLSKYSANAVPGRSFIKVYDADAYLGDAAAMGAARRQVVASNGYHLHLYSLQPDIPTQVDIRIWDAPPPAPGNAEGHVTITLESETGALVVNQLGYGPAGDMTLPRPGVPGNRLVDRPSGQGQLLRSHTARSGRIRAGGPPAEPLAAHPSYRTIRPRSELGKRPVPTGR
jgi:hypothetical protein